MKIKKAPEFVKNVGTLASGALVGQIVAVTFIPILTRMYTPSDFGALALFIAAAATISSVLCGRYELAIMLPADKSEAWHLSILCCVIALLGSLAVLVVITAIPSGVLVETGLSGLGAALYGIPVAAFLLSLLNVLKNLHSRIRSYASIAKATVIKSIAITFLQASFGVAKLGSFGLIFAHPVGIFFSVRTLFIGIRQQYEGRRIRAALLWELAKKYSKFPKFSIWAVLANSLALHSIIFFVAATYDAATLGLFSLAQRVLSIPASLVGASIGQVYYESAVRERRASGVAASTFDKTLILLLVFAVLVFVPLFFLSPYIFDWLLGGDWKNIGQYVQTMLPFVALQFITAALSNTNNAFEKQHYALAWQLALLTITTLVMVSTVMLGADFDSFVQAYSTSLMIYYLVLLMFLRFVARGKL